ncbi:MAG TPA: cytochrome P450 [Acidimicrobiales bacterium]|jgi:cytochrome P450
MESLARVGSENILLSMLTDEMRADPYPLYERWQSAAELYDSGLGVWFVLGHREASALLRRPDVVVDYRDSEPYRAFLTDGAEPPGFGDLPLLIRIDPPEHGRIRGLVRQAFTPRRVEGLRHRAAELVTAALDRIEAAGEADLVAELARPLPITIIADLLAVPRSDVGQLSAWSDWVVRTLDPLPLRGETLNEKINEAMGELLEYLRALIDERRRSTGDDLVTALAAASHEGDRLSDDELLGVLLLLFVAGHANVTALIACGTVALASRPAELAALRTCDDAGARLAVDELLRFDSPVQMTQRTTIEDVDVGGVTIPANQIVVLMVAAANRDPKVFERPRELDLLRQPNPHLSFGGGIHHCLGALLTHVETEVAFPLLARRFSTIEVGDTVLRSTLVARSYESLHVRVSP